MFSAKVSNDFIKFVNPEFVHKDNRGALTQIVSKGKWGQVNYIESQAGAIRGNHYHEINRELFYIINGKFILILENEGKEMKYEILSGDMFIIEPFVNHSFEYLQKTMLITMYDKGVELHDGKMDMLTKNN